MTVVDARGHSILTVQYAGDYSGSAWAEFHEDADATLTAASPDMLALLKELIDIEGPQPGTADWGRKVQAVIAKAEGRA